MPERHQKYLERGTQVRSDMTPQERRDAARRRLELATTELSARLSPAGAVRRSPIIAVGAAVGLGFLVSSLRRGPRRDPQLAAILRELRTGNRPQLRGRTEIAADKAADKTNIRTLILSAVGTAIVAALRDRFLKPNLERLANDALDRFTGRPDPGPSRPDPNPRPRA